MDKKEKISKVLLRYSIITLGCIIYSFGVAAFLDANKIAAGGVTGISIIISSLTGWNTGILIIIINIPMMILGAVYFGKQFCISTVYSVIVSSLMVDGFNWLFENFYHLPITNDILLASVVGGGLFGSGVGIMFRMGSSTGGIDVLVKILSRKFRYIKAGIICLLFDITIVGISVIIHPDDFEIICYTYLSLFVFEFCFDFMLYGGNSAKLVYIVTDTEHSEKLIARLLSELDTGATIMNGTGAYTGDTKIILMCAIKNMSLPRLRDVVREEDPAAFIIVTSAKEIYGEGYKNNTDDEM